jgi:electron transport complex protein RnfB
MSVAVSVLIISGIGMLCALGLVFVSRKFAVRIDHRVEQVVGILSGANCGVCGYANCVALAEAAVKAMDDGGKLPMCVQGGEEVIHGLEDILRIEIPFAEKKISTLLCNGGTQCNDIYEYIGVEDCRESLALNARGDKACRHGCLGRGSCVRACPFDAIAMNPDKLPVVDRSSCVGCGTCVEVCPRNVLRLADASEYYSVACSSKEKGKIVRKQCTAGCIACRKCVKACPVDAVRIADNLAVIDPEKCIGCHKCQEACPTEVIVPLVSLSTFRKFKHRFKDHARADNKTDFH